MPSQAPPSKRGASRTPGTGSAPLEPRPHVDRARGALLGAAIGEAWALAGEDAGRPSVETTFHAGANTLDLVVTARSLVAGHRIDEDHLSAVLPHRKGSHVDARAAIRCVALGLAGGGSLEHIAALTYDHARLTHMHPLGQDAAAVQACAIAWLSRCAAGIAPTRRAVLEAVAPRARTRRMRALVGRLGRPAVDDLFPASLGEPEAYHAVPLALYALFSGPLELEPVLARAAPHWTDEGLSGALEGALVGAAVGDEGLPRGWVDRLQGAGDLADLGERLARIPRV